MICCFSDPPVHWSLKKKLEKSWKQNFFFFQIEFFSKNYEFSFNFWPVFHFIFILFLLTVWNGFGKDLRNNTLIKSGIRSVGILQENYTKYWHRTLFHIQYWDRVNPCMNGYNQHHILDFPLTGHIWVENMGCGFLPYKIYCIHSCQATHGLNRILKLDF